MLASLGYNQRINGYENAFLKMKNTAHYGFPRKTVSS